MKTYPKEIIEAGDALVESRKKVLENSNLIYDCQAFPVCAQKTMCNDNECKAIIFIATQCAIQCCDHAMKVLERISPIVESKGAYDIDYNEQKQIKEYLTQRIEELHHDNRAQNRNTHPA